MQKLQSMHPWSIAPQILNRESAIQPNQARSIFIIANIAKHLFIWHKQDLNIIKIEVYTPVANVDGLAIVLGFKDIRPIDDITWKFSHKQLNCHDRES